MVRPCDVILVDPRVTGWSKPSLACPECHSSPVSAAAHLRQACTSSAGQHNNNWIELRKWALLPATLVEKGAFGLFAANIHVIGSTCRIMGELCEYCRGTWLT